MGFIGRPLRAAKKVRSVQLVVAAEAQGYTASSAEGWRRFTVISTKF